MDTATTPHSQTGNAESYKKASGPADVQCLDYDQTRIKVLGAMWTTTGTEQCSVEVVGHYKIDIVILFVFFSFVTNNLSEKSDTNPETFIKYVIQSKSTGL